MESRTDRLLAVAAATLFAVCGALVVDTVTWALRHPDQITRVSAIRSAAPAPAIQIERIRTAEVEPGP